MRFNILIVLLTLSLLLNGFFLGGYWMARYKARKVEDNHGRITEIARILGLSQEQKSTFQLLKSRAINIRRSYLRKMEALRSRFWKTVVTDPKNTREMNKIIHEMSKEREDYQRAISQIIAEFLGKLTKEQRRKFLDITRGNKVLKALVSG